MAEEILSNNQGDSGAAVPEPTTMAEAANQAEIAIAKAQEAQAGTTTETAKNGEAQAELDLKTDETEEKPAEAKPEFSDPNMQKKFTQKMQELSEQKKMYESAEQKAKAYDELISNEKVVKYLRQEYLGEKAEALKNDEITEDEFVDLTSDKKKFNEYLKKNVQQILSEHTKPLESQVKAMNAELREAKLMQDISDFGDAKDENGNLLHPDFDTFAADKKIDPYLMKLRGSNMSELEKLELAYKLVKSENMPQEITKKAHNIVQQKKQAIGEKGNSAQTNLSSKKALTMKEFAEQKAKEYGIEVP